MRFLFNFPDRCSHRSISWSMKMYVITVYLRKPLAQQLLLEVGASQLTFHTSNDVEYDYQMMAS